MKATPVVRSATQPDEEREGEAGEHAGQEGGRRLPAEMISGEAGAVEPGGEEHRVAEAEEAGIAEEEVVADGEGGEHHDAGEDQVVIVRAARTAGAKSTAISAMWSERRLAGSRLIAPALRTGRPGLTTSTSATSSVARILASVGEKNTEMMPSLMPITSGRDQRALDAAEPADDDDDEGEEQRVEPHQVMRLLDRHDQHAATAASMAPSAKTTA